MSAPINRLKRLEIQWLATHRCIHGHIFLEHYECYLKEYPDMRRIGFFDIEASHLKANFGIILCYCIMDNKSDKIIEGVITQKEIRSPARDSRVVQKAIHDLNQFDIIVGYYSSRFDVPFVRTRALIHGIPFPYYGNLQQKDVYYMVKSRLSLHSKSLEVATRTVFGETGKTHLDPKIWMDAAYGSGESQRKALRYIVEHCREDVKDTKRLYHKMVDFVRPGTVSL